MTFERTRDLERVRRAIAGDARVWAASTDDAAPAREAWRPGADERIIYVIASDECGMIALFTLLPQNAVCYEFHMTRAFGARFAAALKAFFSWVFENTPARRIVGAVPSDNPIAIRALQRAGMRQYGVNEKSFLRGGELRDQILFGVSPA